jgi:hypothetical protein
MRSPFWGISDVPESVSPARNSRELISQRGSGQPAIESQNDLLIFWIAADLLTGKGMPKIQEGIGTSIQDSQAITTMLRTRLSDAAGVALRSESAPRDDVLT